MCYAIPRQRQLMKREKDLLDVRKDRLKVKIMIGWDLYSHDRKNPRRAFVIPTPTPNLSLLNGCQVCWVL